MLRKLRFEPLERRQLLDAVVTVPDPWYVGDYHVLAGEDFPSGKRADMSITLVDGTVIYDNETTKADGSFEEGMTVQAYHAGGLATYTVTAGNVTVTQQFTVMADPTLFVPETITVSDTEKIRAKGTGFIPYRNDEVYFHLVQGENEWTLDHDDVDARGRVNELMYVRNQDDLYNGWATLEARLTDGTVLATSTMTLQGSQEPVLTTSVTVPDPWYVGDYHVLEGQDWPAGKAANMKIILSDNQVIKDRETTDGQGSFKEGMTVQAYHAGGLATYTVTAGNVTVTQQFTVMADPTLFVPESITAGTNKKITGKGFYSYRPQEIYFYARNEGGAWVTLDHDDVDARGRLNEATNFPATLVNGVNVIEARLLDGTVLATTVTTITGGVEPSLSAQPVSPFILVMIVPTNLSPSAPANSYSPANGQLENESLAERTAHGIALTETIERTGLTYYDKGRGVDVYAPAGQYFVEYTNGAVELRYIPANLSPGKDHPTVAEITVNGRSSPNLGQVAKPVALTGRTFFDPARGIDVHASEGKFLIQYQDGTVEERSLPPGGFVPRPSDFTVGGRDDSRPMSAYGPSLEELGLVETGTGQPKPSEELYLIGETYVSSSGILRTAHEGNVFLQDPVTKIILERPKEEARVALTKPSTPPATVTTSETTITDLFRQAYGRAPNGLELTYWRSRTDKEGAALLGAMQYAAGQSVTVTLRAQEVRQGAVEAVFADLGQGVPVSVGELNTVVLDWEWVTNDSALLSNIPQGSGNTLQDAWALWWQETIEFTPPAPTSNAGLEFYMGSPDYVVHFDWLSPERVDYFHAGGVVSVRIRRIGSVGGAQVILDANGNVIMGAGTDDTFSPTNLPLWVGHMVVDVLPWWTDQQLSLS